MAVNLPSSPLGEVDPEFERTALETGEFTFGLTNTTVREKMLQNLTQDICRSHTGLAFRMHVIGSKMYDIPYADLLAAIRFVAPYAGYPAAADALARLKEVAAEINMDTSIVGEPSASTDEIPAPRGLPVPDQWMAEFVGSRTARAWSEARLSAREKAIMALTADVSQQTLDESFALHVELARGAGLTDEVIRDVVRFCAEHSLARASAALRRLDAVLSTL